jgi:hypothetical protein
VEPAAVEEAVGFGGGPVGVAFVVFAGPAAEASEDGVVVDEGVAAEVAEDAALEVGAAEIEGGGACGLPVGVCEDHHLRGGPAGVAVHPEGFVGVSGLREHVGEDDVVGGGEVEVCDTAAGEGGVVGADFGVAISAVGFVFIAGDGVGEVGMFEDFGDFEGEEREAHAPDAVVGPLVSGGGVIAEAGSAAVAGVAVVDHVDVGGLEVAVVVFAGGDEADGEVDALGVGGVGDGAVGIDVDVVAEFALEVVRDEEVADGDAGAGVIDEDFAHVVADLVGVEFDALSDDDEAVFVGGEEGGESGGVAVLAGGGVLCGGGVGVGHGGLGVRSRGVAGGRRGWRRRFGR